MEFALKMTHFDIFPKSKCAVAMPEVGEERDILEEPKVAVRSSRALVSCPSTKQRTERPILRVR